MQYQDIRSLAGRLLRNLSSVIVDKDDVLKLTLAAVFAEGHVLLEDVPGTGKTTLARALAASMGCESARVQFTPDLLPSDITGLRVWDARESAFRFEKGPVFTNILLADEINRATPRTQSALLECMEERTASEGGVTRALPAPFLTIATQNPVENAGTFPLPEAQLDRFLLRLSLGYPSTAGAIAMLRRFEKDSPLGALQPVATGDEISAAAKLCRQCRVSDDLLGYMVALCEAARDPALVRLGPSPRAMLALLKACRALAAMDGRDYVVPDDVKLLAVPVLAHRVIPRGIRPEDTGETVIRQVLKDVPVPAEDRT